MPRHYSTEDSIRDAREIAAMNRRLDEALSKGVRVDGGPPPWMPITGLLLVVGSILALAVILYRA